MVQRKPRSYRPAQPTSRISTKKCSATRRLSTVWRRKHWTAPHRSRPSGRSYKSRWKRMRQNERLAYPSYFPKRTGLCWRYRSIMHESYYRPTPIITSTPPMFRWVSILFFFGFILAPLPVYAHFGQIHLFIFYSMLKVCFGYHVGEFWLKSIPLNVMAPFSGIKLNDVFYTPHEHFLHF